MSFFLPTPQLQNGDKKYSRTSSVLLAFEKKERRVSIQMSALIAAFLLCWSPFWIFNMAEHLCHTIPSTVMLLPSIVYLHMMYSECFSLVRPSADRLGYKSHFSTSSFLVFSGTMRVEYCTILSTYRSTFDLFKLSDKSISICVFQSRIQTCLC